MQESVRPSSSSNHNHRNSSNNNSSQTRLRCRIPIVITSTNHHNTPAGSSSCSPTTSADTRLGVVVNPHYSATATSSSSSSKWSNFETFCNCTSLHGWKYLSHSVNRILKVGWACVVLASMSVAGFFLGYSLNDFVSSTVQTTQDTSRASLDHVFFPSVTLCNINQGRRSFFLEQGLTNDGELLHTVLGQAYFGLREDLDESQMDVVRRLFSSEEVMRKGMLSDMMYTRTTSKEEARRRPEIEELWQESRGEAFVNEAGWYFKTLAAQEPGENNVLLATYGKTPKDTEQFTDFLPFFGTDYGLCSLIKPQISFNESLFHLPFEALMLNHTRTISSGIQLGKENGLTLLLDAEVYDYAFSPQRGEGFKLAIHNHMDQPIMALSDIDLSPGFVTQLSVTPTLRDTTDSARWRFSPEERGCYFDGEMEFKYLPKNLYRYGLSNCLFAATYDQVLERCDCVPFFHTMAFDDYPRICAGRNLSCMNSILRDIGSHTHVRVTDPDTGQTVLRPCLFACRDQSYTTAVTTSIFPNMHTFLRGPEFCLMLRKLRGSCRTSKNVTLEEQYQGLCELIRLFPTLCSIVGSNGQTREYVFNGTLDGGKEDNDDVVEDVIKILFTDRAEVKQRALTLIALLHRYARENLLLANIYIKDPAVTLIRRDQKIPVIWFVANVGGILGLCMGCSLVTVFEVLHHVLLIFLKTGWKSVNRIQKMRMSSSACPSPSPNNMMQQRDVTGEEGDEVNNTGRRRRQQQQQQLRFRRTGGTAGGGSVRDNPLCPVTTTNGGGNLTVPPSSSSTVRRTSF